MAKLNISGWKLGETLGSGGQAQVFLATREADGKQHALKILKNNDQDRQAYGRFCREIDALNKLDHPNIIKIIDHAPEGSSGPLFNAMEYFEGAKSLKALMKVKDNPYKNNELAACRLFIQIACALEACEPNAIIHRDLSPASILILPEGNIKIIDFGICEMGGSERVTQVDENFGTLNYRAPECSPHNETPWSVSTDLYSAGKIVWSAITDRQVFEREKPAFNQCAMRSMFPEHRNRWHLQRIFEKTIRHDRPNRFQSATQARIVAEGVYNMMATWVLPIEVLLYSCPVCRTGELVAPGAVIPVGGYLLFGQSHPDGVTQRICSTCGYCFLINHKQLTKTLDSTRNLE
jgi:serine/threonine protein kinase